ncbi:hypothetical protein GCM10010182_76370 [Actinomadura cremea]|nr:hypothetical protein GCM10010182_76370 [Actinomadura cremea]
MIDILRPRSSHRPEATSTIDSRSPQPPPPPPAVTAIAGVGAASADGPGTDPRVAKAAGLQAWVPIDVGDRGHRVAFVRSALTQLGYYNDCDPTGTNGDLYLQDMVGAVKRFQAAVEAFQKRKKIGVDGYCGRQTFRAAPAAGAERRNTPGLQWIAQPRTGGSEAVPRPRRGGRLRTSGRAPTPRHPPRPSPRPSPRPERTGTTAIATEGRYERSEALIAQRALRAESKRCSNRTRRRPLKAPGDLERPSPQ